MILQIIRNQPFHIGVIKLRAVLDDGVRAATVFLASLVIVAKEQTSYGSMACGHQFVHQLVGATLVIHDEDG